MSAIDLDIEGLDQAARDLEALADRLNAGSDLTVIWAFGGPAAPYALYVHENAEAVHRVGQARFLAQPLEEAAPSLAARIAAGVNAGLSFAEAMRIEAEVHMTAMKELTPVLTGALRGSGHVIGPDGQDNAQGGAA